MKKAFQISIAKTLFTIEEDAYIRLEGYLSAIKSHFKNTEGQAEILSDIENRIAEQLLESKEKVITLLAVEKVLEVMGKVEDFDEGTAKSESQPGQSKKFYRDGEDALIAGVCSGLGAYLNIDPVWVRLAFIGFTFLTGFGILLYIVLWLIVPEAKTKSQRLEMRGEPVTLETLSEKLAETVDERVEEIKNNKENWKSGLRGLIALPFRLVGKVVRGLAKGLGPVLRILIGVIFTLVSLLALVSVMVASGLFVSADILISDGIPLQAILPSNVHVLILAGLALSLTIPFFFILLSGLSILKKKNLISASLGSGLLGVWFVSLLVSGFGAAQVANNYERLAAMAPAYQSQTISLPLSGPFENLRIENGLSVRLNKEATTTLSVNGKLRDIERVEAKVEDGTLIIGRRFVDAEGFCLFCFTGNPEVVLSVPALQSVLIEHGSSLSQSEDGGYFESDQFDLEVRHGAFASLLLKTRDLKVRLSNGSNLSLEGTSENLEASIEHGSSLEARDFEAANAKVTASNGSRAEVAASTTLEALSEHGSEIIYYGDPEVTKKETGGSRVESDQLYFD